MLTPEMQRLINDHPAGMVATINENGTPSVSPKATFVIFDEQTLAFGNLRSPGTLANLRRGAAVEVCFIDVLSRKAVRVTGSASIISKTKASMAMLSTFGERWGEYVPHMSAFVTIAVSDAELIWSPAYDVGYGEAELKKANLEKLNRL